MQIRKITDCFYFSKLITEVLGGAVLRKKMSGILINTDENQVVVPPEVSEEALKAINKVIKILLSKRIINFLRIEKTKACERSRRKNNSVANSSIRLMKFQGLFE